MIFLTVGTQLPFDRLVKAVDKAVNKSGMGEVVFAQIGKSEYRPFSFEAVSCLDKHLFDKHFCEASCIISHAGMGTIVLAMKYNKPLLVMPRRSCYREVVNDHQIAIAKRLEQMGHILVAYKEEEIPEKLEQLKTFVPRERQAQPQAVAVRISRFLKKCAGE